MEDQEKWIRDVINSPQGMKRAKPDNRLFDKISYAINVTDSKIIPLTYVKLVAAAAIILMVLNVWVLRSFAENNTPPFNQKDTIEAEPVSIIYDFDIYK